LRNLLLADDVIVFACMSPRARARVYKNMDVPFYF